MHGAAIGAARISHGTHIARSQPTGSSHNGTYWPEPDTNGSGTCPVFEETSVSTISAAPYTGTHSDIIAALRRPLASRERPRPAQASPPASPASAPIASPPATRARSTGSPSRIVRLTGVATMPSVRPRSKRMKVSPR